MCNPLCDCASEVTRLRDRETNLLRANNAEVERRRGFESEANQAYCELLLLRGECIRLREQNAILSGFIEGAHNGNDGSVVPDEVLETMNAVFPPPVAALVADDDGTRVQSPTVLEALDHVVSILWRRMESEEYGHAKSAVALDIEAVTEFRGKVALA